MQLNAVLERMYRHPLFLLREEDIKNPCGCTQSTRAVVNKNISKREYECYNSSATRRILFAKSHNAPLSCSCSLSVNLKGIPVLFKSLSCNLLYNQEEDFPKYLFAICCQEMSNAISLTISIVLLFTFCIVSISLFAFNPPPKGEVLVRHLLIHSRGNLCITSTRIAHWDRLFCNCG